MQFQWSDAPILALLVAVIVFMILALRRLDRVYRATRGRLDELKQERLSLEIAAKKLNRQHDQYRLAIQDAEKVCADLAKANERFVLELETLKARPKRRIPLLDDAWRAGDVAWEVVVANREMAFSSGGSAQATAASFGRTVCGFGSSAEEVQRRAELQFRKELGWQVQVSKKYDLDEPGF